jgi:hypothetical protein
MTPQQKLEQPLAMHWMARKLKADDLRRQPPEWTTEAVEARVREIFLLATT